MEGRGEWIIRCLKTRNKWSIQEFILEPVLFHIFLNNMEETTEYTLIRFLDDTKLERPAEIFEDRAAIKRD